MKLLGAHKGISRYPKRHFYSATQKHSRDLPRNHFLIALHRSAEFFRALQCNDVVRNKYRWGKKCSKSVFTRNVL